ncbi:MAG: hypothetical protein H7333_05215, partial [Bdellovibrionales bacterium]|nr:hypothetical protein [Oligoflexia bacterium]
MKSKNFSLKLISGIAGCFAISYLAASAAGLTKGEPRFPYSMIKRYSDQGQAWINVKNVIEIPSQGLEEIDLQTLATDIHFETGEKQTIQLLLEGKYLPRKDGSEQVLQYEVKNHALLVRTDESDRSQNFSFSDDAAQGVLTIIVPKEVTVLKLKSLSGKVSGDGLKLSLLDLETISGEFNFTSL